MFQSVGLPHGFCLLWNPQLLWLHILSDSSIALASFLVPIALVRIGLGRKDFRFNGIFFCSSAFIIACGLTHVMEVMTLWHPLYWASGTLKAATAAISIGTLAMLWRVEPLTLAVPSKGSKMARANQRMERDQRIEVLARLSSGLAHEIKNPLAIIHARASDLAEMIADGKTPSATQVAKTCASIVQTSDRAIRILRGVAAMARVATHDPMLPADVNTMIEQAVDLVQGRYKTHDVALETNVPAGLPMVVCREVQISQILVNLLNNAFDAVDGDNRSERWVRVQVSTQSGTQHEHQTEQLQIDVIDGGPGVAPEHRERLMQTFFTTKSMGAGTGIGLSVSRAIAQEHGGQLKLRESDGHTCFRLTLPAHSQHAGGVAA